MGDDVLGPSYLYAAAHRAQMELERQNRRHEAAQSLRSDSLHELRVFQEETERALLLARHVSAETLRAAPGSTDLNARSLPAISDAHRVAEQQLLQREFELRFLTEQTPAAVAAMTSAQKAVEIEALAYVADLFVPLATVEGGQVRPAADRRFMLIAAAAVLACPIPAEAESARKLAHAAAELTVVESFATGAAEREQVIAAARRFDAFRAQHEQSFGAASADHAVERAVELTWQQEQVVRDERVAAGAAAEAEASFTRPAATSLTWRRDAEIAGVDLKVFETKARLDIELFLRNADVTTSPMLIRRSEHLVELQQKQAVLTNKFDEDLEMFRRPEQWKARLSSHREQAQQDLELARLSAAHDSYLTYAGQYRDLPEWGRCRAEVGRDCTLAQSAFYAHVVQRRVPVARLLVDARRADEAALFAELEATQQVELSIGDPAVEKQWLSATLDSLATAIPEQQSAPGKRGRSRKVAVDPRQPAIDFGDVPAVVFDTSLGDLLSDRAELQRQLMETEAQIALADARRAGLGKDAPHTLKPVASQRQVAEPAGQLTFADYDIER